MVNGSFQLILLLRIIYDLDIDVARRQRLLLFVLCSVKLKTIGFFYCKIYILIDHRSNIACLIFRAVFGYHKYLQLNHHIPQDFPCGNKCHFDRMEIVEVIFVRCLLFALLLVRTNIIYISCVQCTHKM